MNSLYQKLASADQVCEDCGTKYGKYSVGCSSVWIGTCDVCGETTGVTEVRDYGYLGKGLQELRENIKNQSKKVATHMLTLEQPVMSDEELEGALEENLPSYERGEITLKLTEDEVGFLNECLDVIVDNHEGLCPGHSSGDPETVKLFEGIEKKITELYEDNCVRYELSPALKAYIAKHGSAPGPDDDAKWEVFRDTYNWLMGEGSGQ